MNPHLLGTTAWLTVTSGASLFAQVASSENGGGVVTVTSAGATVSAVAALAYVAKLMASGKLVARNVADSESQTQLNLQTVTETNKVLAELLADGKRREDRLYELVLALSGGGHPPTPPELGGG